MANIATLKSKPRTPSAPAAPASGPVRFAMRSHRGLVRHANQDACAALSDHGAFVVCDGVGGAAAGEVASHLATDAFLNSLAQPARPSRTAHAPDTGFPPDHPHSRLQQAIRAANHAVFQRAQKSHALRGMGTTLVALLMESALPGGPVWIAHVGDSRCYLFRRGKLQLLTQDHSLVEEQVRAGQISRAEAESSPMRNIITRAVGTQPAVDAEIAAHPVESGDLFLLASDGLTRELDEANIARIVGRAPSAGLEAVCQALVDAANAAGGRDNITVLLLACP